MLRQTFGQSSCFCVVSTADRDCRGGSEFGLSLASAVVSLLLIVFPQVRNGILQELERERQGPFSRLHPSIS